MRFSLLPRDKTFYRLFEQLVLEAQEAVKVFQTLLLSWKMGHPSIQTLRDLEHSCDRFVHEIMMKVNATFVTPIDREDIHRLVKKIDDLADFTQSVSNKMQIFEIEFVRDDLQELAAVLEKAVALVVAAVFKLFTHKQAQEILEYCVQVNTLENQGDRIFERALAALFHGATDPFEVIKWKDIYESVESAIDTCEDITDVLWSIVVKYG